MKTIYKILSLLVLMLSMAGIASATCIVNSPGASAILIGDVLLNVTSTSVHTQNCTVSASSTLAGDTWTTPILRNNTATPNLANQSNATVSTTGLVDANDWSITFTCINASSQTVETCTRSGLTVDNTIPVCGTATPADASKDVDGKATLTQPCTNATSATVYIDGTSYSMTESADSCTYAASIYTNGFHTWYSIISDGTNTTTCSSLTLEVRKPGAALFQPSGNGGSSTSTPSTSNNTNLVMVGAVAVIGWMLLKNKGGSSTTRKRRRKNK